MLADEAALISAIDTKQILSWPDFEYVLCLVIENRILRLYQANLERLYKLQWSELENSLLADDRENSEDQADSKNKKKKKRRK